MIEHHGDLDMHSPRQSLPFFARPFALIGLIPLVLAFDIPMALAAQNDCGSQGATIVKNAYPAAQETSDQVFEVDGATIKVSASAYDDPHAMICRVWPSRPELTLVAVPLVTRQSDDGNEGDLELLVVNSSDSAVRQRLRLPHLMTDDALYISSIAFDTARYRLAPGKTAFGLRVSLQGSSRPNPFGETTLRLFRIDDKERLTPVLDNIVVSSNQGEWDTNCAGEFHNTDRTLSMAPSAGNAIADIVVDETSTTTISTPGKDGACIDTKTAGSNSYRLRYEASGYRVPEGLSRTE
ncbi:hypothetical protein [Shinella sp. M27]|uniref:hypothetical protein n=1 Tax=Shinella sp. M27 TaxID=3368614 RepID=UPI003BA166D8